MTWGNLIREGWIPKNQKRSDSVFHSCSELYGSKCAKVDFTRFHIFSERTRGGSKDGKMSAVKRVNSVKVRMDSQVLQKVSVTQSGRSKKIGRREEKKCDDTIRISPLLSMSLHGKIAVITGAGSGLGRGFAVAFVKEGMPF